MKKAKIILTAIALFALVGGALAFKALRSVQGKLFYTTIEYISGTVTYTKPGLATFCVPTTTISYWTTVANGVATTGLRTTAVPTTSTFLYRADGAPGTLTIPSYTCVATTLFTTNNPL